MSVIQSDGESATDAVVGETNKEAREHISNIIREVFKFKCCRPATGPLSIVGRGS